MVLARYVGQHKLNNCSCKLVKRCWSAVNSDSFDSVCHSVNMLLLFKVCMDTMI